MDTDDKFFLALMSVMSVIMAMIIAGLSIAIIVAIWQAGMMNFLFWTGLFAFIAWASRIVYRRAIRDNWLEKY